MRTLAVLLTSFSLMSCASSLSKQDKEDLLREIRAAASVPSQVTSTGPKVQTFEDAMRGLTEAPAGGGELTQYDQCVLRTGGYAICDEELKEEVP